MNFPMADKTFDLVRPLSQAGLGMMWSPDTKSAILGYNLKHGTTKTLQLYLVKVNCSLVWTQ